MAGVPRESLSSTNLPGEFMAEMVSAVDARLPLDDALRAAADEAGSRRVERSFQELAERIARGEPAEVAFANIKHHLPASLVTLLQAALRSGRFAESLRLWMTEQQQLDDLRREMRGALLYPLFVLATSFVVVISIAIAFGSVFESLYQEFGLRMSWEVRTTIWLSHHAHEFLISLPVMVVALLGLRWLLGAHRWNSLLSELPLMGSLWYWLSLASWARWLAMFIDARLPLAESLRIVGDATGDFRIALASQMLAEKVERGEALSSAMADASPWPATASLMVRWGEHSSTLAESLRGIASLYEGRLRLRRRWVRIALPLLAFLLVGFAILFAYILMFNPIMSLTSAFM